MSERRRILVVDREPEWRHFVTQVLHEAGYAVSVHQDAHSTLQEISTEASDLILTDASLSDLIDRLATDHTELRFIVFTTSPSVAEAIATYRRGALDYESKSFDAGLILAIVQAALLKQPTRAPRFAS